MLHDKNYAGPLEATVGSIVKSCGILPTGGLVITGRGVFVKAHLVFRFVDETTIITGSSAAKGVLEVDATTS